MNRRLDPHEHVRSVRLDVQRYAMDLSRSRVETESYVDAWLKESRYTLVFEVLSQSAEQTIRYPATWWEHFKQRWFPKRLLARYPVKLTTVTVTARALLPDVWPLERRYAVFYVAEPPRWKS